MPEPDRDYLPPDPRTAHESLLALARMAFYVSEDQGDWSVSRPLIRRLAREALVAVGEENKQESPDAR